MAQLSISHGLLYLAGFLHLLLVVLHLAFPKLLKWDKALPQMDSMNRGVYLTIHWMLILWLASIGSFLILGADMILEQSVGTFLLAIISLQWILRLVFQWVYFLPWRGVEKWLTLGFVLLVASCGGPILISL
ncbi:MAG: hypothetical protein AAF927_28460 [Bacteroidota bacterium]